MLTYILFTKIKSRSFSRRGKPKKAPPPLHKDKKGFQHRKKIAKRLPHGEQRGKKKTHGEKSSKKAPHIAKHISFFIF